MKIKKKIKVERTNLRYVFPGFEGSSSNIELMQNCPLFTNAYDAVGAAINYVNSKDEEWMRAHKFPRAPRRFVFRGQSNKSWALLPSLFQRLDWGPLPWKISILEAIRDEIKARRKITETFKNDLVNASSRGLIVPDVRDFNPDELELTARHYGFPSMFIDFTTNPKTAGFFATEKINQARIGIIYILDLYLVSTAVGVSAFGPHGNGTGALDILFASSSIAIEEGISLDISSLSSANFRFSMKTAPLSRIKAQNAVFLSISSNSELDYKNIDCIGHEYWTWYALDYLSTKFCFRQTGETYEDEKDKIAQKYFMPENDTLQNFVTNWHN